MHFFVPVGNVDVQAVTDSRKTELMNITAFVYAFDICPKYTNAV